ncbi:unnamed protein product, partial [marine sediment metagenome]
MTPSEYDQLPRLPAYYWWVSGKGRPGERATAT